MRLLVNSNKHTFPPALSHNRRSIC